MTGLVQTSSEATGSWSLFPLIVSRDFFGHHTWARFQPSGAQPALFGCRLIYIFDIYYLLTMPFVYWFLWPLRLVWLLVCCLYMEVYLQIFKCVSFWLHREWEGGPVSEVNHTSWLVVVTPTDRPKSVRNCCLIELFCGVVCVVTLPFWHFCWCRGFCHRTGSDLLLFVFICKLFIKPQFISCLGACNTQAQSTRKGRRRSRSKGERRKAKESPHGKRYARTPSTGRERSSPNSRRKLSDSSHSSRQTKTSSPRRRPSKSHKRRSKSSDRSSSTRLSRTPSLRWRRSRSHKKRQSRSGTPHTRTPSPRGRRSRSHDRRKKARDSPYGTRHTTPSTPCRRRSLSHKKRRRGKHSPTGTRNKRTPSPGWRHSASQKRPRKSSDSSDDMGDTRKSKRAKKSSRITGKLLSQTTLTIFSKQKKISRTCIRMRNKLNDNKFLVQYNKSIW